MKKFIIEIPDSTLWIDVPQSIIKEDGSIIFPTKSVPVENLTPYTVDCKDVEEEVWNFAAKIERMTCKEVYEVFGIDPAWLCNQMSYKEAKAKYEAWLKQRDEIEVGDEVENTSHKKGIVFKISSSNSDLEYVRVLYMECGNAFTSAWEKNKVKKTGRHFPEVVQLLEKMRGEE